MGGCSIRSPGFWCLLFVPLQCLACAPGVEQTDPISHPARCADYDGLHHSAVRIDRQLWVFVCCRADMRQCSLELLSAKCWRDVRSNSAQRRLDFQLPPSSTASTRGLVQHFAVRAALHSLAPCYPSSQIHSGCATCGWRDRESCSQAHHIAKLAESSSGACLCVREIR